MSTVTIESTRFGTLEIASEDVIEFPNGLIGLGGKQFTIVPAGNGGAFSWLHSIDDPSLALPIANPWHFFADYVVDLSDEDSEPITADPADVTVWVTVRAGAELASFHTNLRAPMVRRRWPGPSGDPATPATPRSAPSCSRPTSPSPLRDPRSDLQDHMETRGEAGRAHKAPSTCITCWNPFVYFPSPQLNPRRNHAAHHPSCRREDHGRRRCTSST